MEEREGGGTGGAALEDQKQDEQQVRQEHWHQQEYEGCQELKEDARCSETATRYGGEGEAAGDNARARAGMEMPPKAGKA